MNRNYSLDFSRGLMALAVALGHYFYCNNNTNSFPLSFILAVDYFFILSGYVLTGSILNKNNFDTLNFAKSRWLRLFPVYIFCVIVSLILCYSLGIQQAKPRLGDIIKIISIGQMLPFNTGSKFLYLGPLDVAWSISAEFWIGIIFFPVIYFLNKNRSELCFVFLTLSILVSFFIINNYSPNYLDVNYVKYTPLIFFGLLRGYMGYSLGALTFFITKVITKDSVNNHKSSFISLLQLTLLLILIILYARNNYNRRDEYFSIFLFAIMIISLSFEKGFVYNLTNNWCGKWLGKISYPLYLLHPIFIEVNRQIFENLFSLVPILLYLLFTIIFSILIHIYIENKFLIYFRK